MRRRRPGVTAVLVTLIALAVLASFLLVLAFATLGSGP
jgi:hypothetical protein